MTNLNPGGKPPFNDPTQGSDSVDPGKEANNGQQAEDATSSSLNGGLVADADDGGDGSGSGIGGGGIPGLNFAPPGDDNPDVAALGSGKDASYISIKISPETVDAGKLDPEFVNAEPGDDTLAQGVFKSVDGLAAEQEVIETKPDLGEMTAKPGEAPAPQDGPAGSDAVGPGDLLLHRWQPSGDGVPESEPDSLQGARDDPATGPGAHIQHDDVKVEMGMGMAQGDDTIPDTYSLSLNYEKLDAGGDDMISDGTSEPQAVDVRGWDPVKKEPFVGKPDGNQPDVDDGDESSALVNLGEKTEMSPISDAPGFAGDLMPAEFDTDDDPSTDD
jgi:hypothetical protein